MPRKSETKLAYYQKLSSDAQLAAEFWEDDAQLAALSARMGKRLLERMMQFPAAADGSDAELRHQVTVFLKGGNLSHASRSDQEADDAIDQMMEVEAGRL